MRLMVLFIMAVAVEVRAKLEAMVVVRATVLGRMALRAMSVVPAEERPKSLAIVAVRAKMLTTMASVAASVARTMAAVLLLEAMAMVTVEARATATAMTSALASGVGNGGNGMTTDICDAILPRYANFINVGSNGNGDHAPAIDGGNIFEGAANFGIGMQRVCQGSSMTAGRGQQHRRRWQQWWQEEEARRHRLGGTMSSLFHSLHIKY
jgi:hypothetical protein